MHTIQQYYTDCIKEALLEDKKSECGGNSNFNRIRKIILHKFETIGKDKLEKSFGEDSEELITEVTKAIESNDQFAIDAIKLRAIADYVSGMTDRMAEKKYNEICSSSTQWNKAYTERGTFTL